MRNASPFPQDFAANDEQLARLNERHKRIIESNSAYIAGKQVLDLASANGRWTWAAAKAGATSVVGVEGRPTKVAEARRLIQNHGMSGKCRFERGDMYQWLQRPRAKGFNTIFCLGVYYHVMDHFMLMKLMTQREPDCIILDSVFLRSFQLSVRVKTENPNRWTSALPSFKGQRKQLVGVVSLGLLVQMALNCGYRCEPIIWNPREVSHPRAVKDYLGGVRYTVRLTQHDNADYDWKTLWRATLRALNPRFETVVDRDDQVLSRRARSIHYLHRTVSGLSDAFRKN